MHQHFAFNPLLDSLLIRHLIEVLVHIAELVDGKAGIPGRPGAGSGHRRPASGIGTVIEAKRPWSGFFFYDSW